MDEELLIFGLIAGILALLAASPILAIIAIVKVNRLGRELRTMAEDRPVPVPGPVPGPVVEPAPAPAPGPEPVAEAPRPEPEPVAGGPFAEERPQPPPPKAAPKPAPKAVVAPPPREPRIPLHKRIDWERWAGVRGAAALGGIFFALAAILLFKHAFENQWIGPAARCWLGAGAGVVFIAGAHFLRGRGVRFAPGALEGAGLVAFYASIWAAYQLYSFLSLAGAFPLMAAVTALACALSMWHRSQLTAVLGLVGGFTAAWLLQAQDDRPLGLFGWILLLDLGLIFVGQKRGWPLLGFAALLGTFFFENLWIFGSMDPERMAIGLGILAVFMLLFVLAGQWAPGEKKRFWMPSQAGAVVFPFVFAVYFASRQELNEHIYPTASLLALLAAAACFLARTQGTRWMPLGAASGCVSVVGVWMFGTPLTPAMVWELAGVSVGLALIFHVFAEWEERLVRAPEGRSCGLRTAATVAAAGWLLLVGFGASYSVAVPFWPFLSAFAALALVLVRQSFFEGRAWTAFLAGAGAGLGCFFFQNGHLEYGGFPLPDPRLLVAILVAFGGGFLLLGMARAGRPNGRTSLQAVGLFAIPACLGFLGSDRYFLEHDPWLLSSGILALGLLTAAAATKLGSRTWFTAAVVLTATMQALWWAAYEDEKRTDGALTAIVLMGASAALFTWWPLLFANAFRSRILPWIVASVSVPVWYSPLHELYIVRFSDKAMLTAPLVAGLVVLTAALRVPSVLREEDEARTPARIWYWGVALILFCLALPIHLHARFEVDWLAVTLGLYAGAMAFLAHRLANRTVGAFAMGVGALSLVLLLLQGFDSGYYGHEEHRFFNWITYGHLVPAAALIAAAVLLRPRAAAAAGRSEGAHGRVRALESPVLGLAAIVTVFLWINLTILNLFSAPGDRLSFGFERMQDRDLTTSLAWAVYALVLLGFGMRLKLGGLRWTSLVLLLATIAKLFLYDLSELEGLYRVGSFAGLALSLLCVSLLYQRFVFRAAPEPRG